MKKTITASAVAFAAAAINAASCAYGQTVWQGDMFITKAPAGCPFHIGDSVQGTYAPMGLPGNSTSQDQLAIFSARFGASQFVPASGGTLNGATKLNDVDIGKDGSGGGLTTPTSGTITVSPHPVTAGAPVAISIPDLAGSSTCTISFSGVLVPQPGTSPN